MLVDQKTEGVVVPLNLALDCTGRLELANSSLSEMAVLGVCAPGGHLTLRGTEADVDSSLNTGSAGRSPTYCRYGKHRSVGTLLLC